MIKRILINGLLTTVVQIVFYVIILYLFATFGALIFDSQGFAKGIENIGYSVIMSVLLLGTILLPVNLILSIINKKVWTFGLLTIVAAIYFIAWIEDFSNWPWTTVLFLLVGLTTIYLKFFLDKKLEGLLNS
jgi:hypothetical protein